MDIRTLMAARMYVRDTANGLGAVKGSPCTITSITEADDGIHIVFSWTGTDGTVATQTAIMPYVAVDKVAREAVETLRDDMDAAIDTTVRSINGRKPDSAGNVALPLSVTGVPNTGSPNQVFVTDGEGKPGWEDRTHGTFAHPLRFDGNSEGRETFEDSGLTYVKISDTALTAQQLLGAKFHVAGWQKLMDTIGADMPDEMTITEDMLDDNGVAIAVIYTYFPILYSVYADAAAPKATSGTTPTIGTYMMYMPAGAMSNGLPTEPVYVDLVEWYTVKQLPEEYIPDSIVRVESLGSLPSYTTHGVGASEEIVTYDGSATGGTLGSYYNVSSLVVNENTTFNATLSNGNSVALTTSPHTFSDQVGVNLLRGSTQVGVALWAPANIAGIYLSNTAPYVSELRVSIGEVEVEMVEAKSGVILSSTTAGSTKKFAITVDDSGTITATEVTE